MTFIRNHAAFAPNLSELGKHSAERSFFKTSCVCSIVPHSEGKSAPPLAATAKAPAPTPERYRNPPARSRPETRPPPPLPAPPTTPPSAENRDNPRMGRDQTVVNPGINLERQPKTVFLLAPLHPQPPASNLSPDG